MARTSEKHRGWMLNGKPVSIPPTADIPTVYRPGNPLADITKEALTNVDPWSDGGSTRRTVQLRHRSVTRIVVSLGGQMPIWFKHKGHHARHVQLSPFVRSSHPGITDEMTLEFVGTFGRARLVRAYPGDYMPPLPWMASARDAEGGVERSIEFWRTHAYVLTSSNTVQGSGTGRHAPSWFTNR